VVVSNSLYLMIIGVIYKAKIHTDTHTHTHIYTRTHTQTYTNTRDNKYLHQRISFHVIVLCSMDWQYNNTVLLSTLPIVMKTPVFGKSKHLRDWQFIKLYRLVIPGGGMQPNAIWTFDLLLLLLLLLLLWSWF